MRLNLKTLRIEFRESTEILEFPKVSYFYGPIGPENPASRAWLITAWGRMSNGLGPFSASLFLLP